MPTTSIDQDPESAMAPEDASKPPFFCALCNRTFNSRNAIEDHNIDKHKASSAPPRVPVFVQASAMTAFTCSICDKVFETKDAAIRHNMNAHAPQNLLEAVAIDNLTCYPCDRIFGTQKALWAHENDSHYPQTCHCNARFPGWKSFREHKKVCLPNQTVTLKEIKQESVYNSNVELYSEPLSERLDGSDSDLGDDSEDDSEGESEGDSESDLEDDSECESADESEVNMKQHLKVDALESDEDDQGPKWPEYGQAGRIPCLFSHVSCAQVFSTASMMLQHVELHYCPADMLWSDFDIFDYNAWSRKVYDDIKVNYKCPNCKNKGGGRFDYLFQLVDHAESNQCNLRVCTGPIKEIRSKLLEFADEWE
ncbi:hypothetical protein FVEN_g9162 [Fusarium venenatum]|nr:hypothetical protein FVEN_g9162 [Fusarium venenatum]KAH7006380.1 hypothetical protein EDB82DRAFT_522329 [Fusarium venenatum]